MEKLKKFLSNYYNVDYDKIYLIERAFLGLYLIFSKIKGNKKKVLYTSTPCHSPVLASIFAGLEPVFVDISLSDYLMDECQTLKSIEKHKNEIAALVYVYTFGHSPKSLIKIKEKCKENNIVLIEDVAQALGAETSNLKCGLIGDYSVFSFGYSKHVDATCGGFIINNSDSNFINETYFKNYKLPLVKKDIDNQNYREEYYKLRKKALLDHSKFLSYVSFFEKYKSLYFEKKIPNWKNILHKLKIFINDEVRYRRNRNANLYRSLIMDLNLNSKIFCPKVFERYSVYRYTILTQSLEDTIKLSDLIRKNGIDCSNLYIPVSRFFHNLGYSNSLIFSKTCINLWVDFEDKKRIYKTVKIINDYYKKI